MRKYLIDTKQVLSHGIQRSDDPYHQNSILGIVNYESDWYIPFIVQQYFTGLETRTPIIEEYNDFPDVIYITSDKKWDSSDIQIPHYLSVIVVFECSQPDKYTDNSENDVLTDSISSIYITILAEGLSDKRLQYWQFLQRIVTLR